MPGRLCLFGEHSDWAGAERSQDADIAPGACVVCGTNQGIRATVTASAALEIGAPGLRSGLPPALLPMEAGALRQTAQGEGFFRYVAGVAAIVSAQYTVGGLHLSITDQDLPVQRGLSSSAAACVLVARAFNRVYRLGLSVRDEMELAYRGELATGSQCGRMDQACAFGQVPVLLRFDGERMEVEPLTAAATLYMAIVDLRRHKDTRRILSDLHACFSGPPSPLRARLRQALGDENLRIVAAARAAMAQGDAVQLGELMREAQAVFDQNVAPCSDELSAPRLQQVLHAPETLGLVWGGKGVGSQGDGAAQFVCRGEAERAELMRRLCATYDVECLALTIAAGN